MLLRIRYDTRSSLFRVLNWTPDTPLLECESVRVSERGLIDGPTGKTLEENLDWLRVGCRPSRFVVYPVDLPTEVAEFRDRWAIKCEYTNGNRRVMGLYKRGNAQLDFFGAKVMQVQLTHEGIGLPMEWDFGRWRTVGRNKRYDGVLLALMDAATAEGI